MFLFFSFYLLSILLPFWSFTTLTISRRVPPHMRLVLLSTLFKGIFFPATVAYSKVQTELNGTYSTALWGNDAEVARIIAQMRTRKQQEDSY